ncbi:hypothetical protein ACUXST_002093 [Sphingomonas sp. F9_3S_D5_B_2]
MTEADTRPGAERLPWLGNEAVAPDHHSLGRFAAWFIPAALVISGGAYVLLAEDEPNQQPPQQVTPALSTTVALPPAQTSTSKRVAKSRVAHTSTSAPATASSAPVPQSAHAVNRISTPKVAPPVTLAGGECECRSKASARQKTVVAAKSPAPAQAKVAAPARVAVQAAPRLPGRYYLRPTAALPQPRFGSQKRGGAVQFGAFVGMQGAQATWRQIERAYPPINQFHASVIENRDWNGQRFNQFQIETASQADSEMLCQSLARYKFRCTVMALPLRPASFAR